VPDSIDLETSERAADQAALALWILTAALVLLGYASAWRAQAVAGADAALGEVVVLRTQDTAVLVGTVAVVLLTLVSVVFWVRWEQAASAQLRALGDCASPPVPLRQKRLVNRLWSSGGEAARPRVFEYWFAAVLTATGVLAVALVWPEDYDAIRWLDPVTVVGCVLGIAATLTSIGILRRITDRHAARAAFLASRADAEAPAPRRV
jgi:lipid-A-disaccharide synthase-like uncharacterized protein